MSLKIIIDIRNLMNAEFKILFILVWMKPLFVVGKEKTANKNSMQYKKSMWTKYLVAINEDEEFAHTHTLVQKWEWRRSQCY